MKEKNQQQ